MPERQRGDPYNPVPGVQPKDIPTPAVRITTPHVEFTKAIGQALGELGHSYGVLGQAGEALGHSFSNAGKMVEGAGDQLWQRALAIQGVKNEAEVNEANSKYDLESGLMEADFHSKLGNNAAGALPAYLKQQQDLRQRIRDSLSNDAVKQAFDIRSMTTMGRAVRSGALWSGQQQKAAAISAAGAEVSAAIRAVENAPLDQDVYADSVQRLRDQRKNYEGLLGHTSREADIKVQEDLDKLLATKLSSGASERPEQSWEDFQAVGSTLPEPMRNQVEHTIMNERRQSASRNIADEVTRDYKQGAPDLDKTVPQRVEEGEKRLEALGLDDTKTRAMLRREIEGRVNDYHQDQTQFKYRAENQLMSVLTGAKTKGEIPKDRNAAFAADRKLKPYYDSLDDIGKKHFDDAIETANRKDRWVDPQLSMQTKERLEGLYINDPIEFFNKTRPENLFHKDTQLNTGDRNHIVSMREKMIFEDAAGEPVKRAISVLQSTHAAEMEELDVYSRTKDNKDLFDGMTGALKTEMEEWKRVHGKYPNNKQISEDIAPRVLKYTPGQFWKGMVPFSGVPFFSEKPYWMQNVPDEFRDQKLESARKEGVVITEAEIKRQWLRNYLRDLNKPKAPQSGGPQGGPE